MLLRTPDKKAMWSEIVLRLEERVEPGLFYMLLYRCYLDSAENGKAIIIAQTRSLQTTLEQKSLRLLQKAVEAVTGQKLQIVIVVGHPRIIENDQKEQSAVDDEQELAALHKEYGDIMGIVNGHFVFRQACQKINKGGWGIFPPLLTDACKEYGVMTVLKGLRYVANQPKVEDPRAFFFDRLRRGEFGYRLAVSAPTLGRVLP